MFELQNPAVILLLGVGAAFIIYGILHSKETKEESQGDATGKTQIRGDREFKISFLHALKFGFGFGIGLLFSGLVFAISLAGLFGMTLATLFSR